MKRRKRRKKRQILPEPVPEKHSPPGAKGSAFTLATAPTQGLYSTKDRIVKILSFSDLNAKVVEVNRNHSYVSLLRSVSSDMPEKIRETTFLCCSANAVCQRYSKQKM